VDISVSHIPTHPLSQSVDVFVGINPGEGLEVLEGWSGERLGEVVGDHVVGRAVVGADGSIGDVVADEVNLDVEVF
jgi:hypothetical protein